MKIVNPLTQPKKWLYRAVVLLVLVGMLATSIPTPVQAAACAYKHKVVAGDTLAYLGYLYQVDWLKIAEANKLTPPYVLQIGQTLCIPAGASPPPISGTPGAKGEKKQPLISALASMNSVIVSVENFLPQRNYYIHAMVGLPMGSYRIGRMRTNKEGKATDNYKLPSFLLERPEMILCAKDVLNDATLCVRYTNPFYKVYRNYIYCIKNGR